MEDLMTVIKEAKTEAIKVLEPILNEFEPGGQFNFEADFFKKLSKTTEDALKPYYERIKDQVSLSQFINLVILDMQFNFMGGALISPDEGKDIIIDLK